MFFFTDCTNGKITVFPTTNWEIFLKLFFRSIEESQIQEKEESPSSPVESSIYDGSFLFGGEPCVHVKFFWGKKEKRTGKLKIQEIFNGRTHVSRTPEKT